MKYFALLALVIVSVYAQTNEIDVVLKLLADLKNNAQTELETLQRDFAATKMQKQDLINQLQRSTSSQRGECNQRDQDWANKERDIKITFSFINWLEKRIKENNARLQRLDINRCESNANFINDIKNSKKILNMITFLRKAIKSAKEGDLPALLQSAQFIQLKSYLSEDPVDDDTTGGDDNQEPEDAYDQNGEQASEDNVDSQDIDTPDTVEISNIDADDSNQEEPAPIAFDEPAEDIIIEADEPQELEVPEHPLEEAEKVSEEQLQQQAEALNRIIAKGKAAQSEEAPVDDGKYANFSAAQQELLRFLDQLEAEVKGTFNKVQDNQVRSAMGLNDFKGLIHKENEAFQGHIVAENQNLDKLQNQLITILQATAACKSRLKQIQQTIDLAQEDLDGAEAHFVEVSEKYEEELNTFDDLGAKVKDISRMCRRKSPIENYIDMNYDYEVLQEIGRGSYGIVYKVRYNSQILVLKEINLSNMSLKQQNDAYKEVQIMSDLDHPHIIHYRTSLLYKNKLLIFMEAAEIDLFSLVRNTNDLKEQQIWLWIMQILEGLNYLHNKNVIHRDLKPNNILLKQNMVKISDLGVSKIQNAALLENESRVGTPLYLAPELIKNKPYNNKIDMWALGCVIYFMCQKEAPFSGSNLISLGYNIVNKPAKPINAKYSRKLQNFIQKLLNKVPDFRPTAKECIEQLTIPVIVAIDTRLKINDPFAKHITVSERRDQSQILQLNKNPKHTIDISINNSKIINNENKMDTTKRFRNNVTELVRIKKISSMHSQYNLGEEEEEPKYQNYQQQLQLKRLQRILKNQKEAQDRVTQQDKFSRIILENRYARHASEHFEQKEL